MTIENRSDLYGSSELFKGTPTEITGMFAPGGSTSMPLGCNQDDDKYGLGFEVGPKGRHKGHALTFGRTRGGKGVSSIVPALLTYQGSMVVIDPKGENAWITAERRRALGQRVVILDPWGEVNKRYGSKVGVAEQVSNFNPLAALDPEGPDFSDDVTAIAEALILQSGNDPYWSDSARELTAGLIAAVVQRQPGIASMRTVRKLLRAPMEILRQAVNATIEEFPDSVAAGKLAAFVEQEEGSDNTNGKEISSIRSTARTQTAFLDSAALIDSMETGADPFNLSDLATGRVTLYLVLPVNRLRSHGRWLRMILTLVIGAIASVPEPPDLPVTLLLDELGTISPGSGLSMIEQSYGLMAGLGIRIWAFLQDLPQLQRDYPNSWETFISNSSIIQLLNVADGTTSKYFSDYLGTATVNARTGGRSLKTKPYADPNQYENRVVDIATAQVVQMRGTTESRAREAIIAVRQGTHRKARNDNDIADDTVLTRAIDIAINALKLSGWDKMGFTEWTDDEQLAARPVMFPWELVDVDATTTIVIVPGRYNLHLKRFRYFSDPVMSGWARRDPNKPAFVPAEPSRPAAPVPAPVQTPAYIPPAAPVYQPAAPSAASTVGAVAGELGSAVGGWLQKKVQDKLGGK